MNTPRAYLKRPLFGRLWQYQAERLPLAAVIVLVAPLLGVVYTLADSSSSLRYLTAVLITVLYILQIRLSDERKDFEHDNVYHPDRPVQRGLVSLAELARVNTFIILAQLIVYAAFLEPWLLLLGALSQAYAYLTRREFFVRTWLRRHFLLYNLVHFAQLLILGLVLFTILQVPLAHYLVLIPYALAHALIVEVGRKVYGAEKDTVVDSYSGRLGHHGAALSVVAACTLAAALSFYLVWRFGYDVSALYTTATVLAATWVSGVVYVRRPNERNARMLRMAAATLYVMSALSVVIGAYR